VQSGVGLQKSWLVTPILQLIRRLERDGAKAITTSCGFFVLLQQEMQAAVKIPVITSSLLQLPALLALQGIDVKSEFATAILGSRATMDIEKAGADVLAAARASKQREPSLQCVVLECTNMQPYRTAIEAATGLKTWALTDAPRLTNPWRPPVAA
jgi:aspartate/glutamate racemase